VIGVDIATFDLRGGASGLNSALTSMLGDVVVLTDNPQGFNDRARLLLAEIFADPNVSVAYCDEVVTDSRGRHLWSSYKPDWSPERFRSQYYIGDFVALRRLHALEVLVESVVDDASAPLHGIAQLWDLVLRITERGGEVIHIAETLFGRKLSDPMVSDRHHSSELLSCAEVVQAHCDRIGVIANVEISEPGNSLHLRRHVDPSTKVSLIIPTCGSSGVVWGQSRVFIIEFIESITNAATWSNLEFVVVADTSTPDIVHRALDRLCGDQLVWVVYDAPFNFSDKINKGRDVASGDVLLLLNDDMEVITPDFIEELVGLALDPGVGAVGARLLLADGRLQHIGHRYADGTFHVFAGYDGDYAGPDDMCLVTRECIGVTAACLAIRTSTFDQLGGMAIDFPNNFNDVDFCLRLREAGYRNIVTPHATLFHFESVTRDGTVTAEEAHLLFTRWGEQLRSDPYSNPNLQAGRIEWIEQALR
jgi:hypothetical protein